MSWVGIAVVAYAGILLAIIALCGGLREARHFYEASTAREVARCEQMAEMARVVGGEVRAAITPPALPAEEGGGYQGDGFGDDGGEAPLLADWTDQLAGLSDQELTGYPPHIVPPPPPMAPPPPGMGGGGVA